MRHLNISSIAILGLGLMGGSLAAALRTSRDERGESFTVKGIARRSASVELALEHGFIDEGSCDPVSSVRDADIVILCTPVRTSIELLVELEPYFKPGCIVTDIGSTKAEIAEAMSKLPPQVDPIGGHPMCGKEVSGLEEADAQLFRSQVYVLTPLERTSERAAGVMSGLVDMIGSRCVILTPSRHDRLVAAISHLPYLLATCLVSTTADVATIDQLVWDLASSGFRDTTRLAGSELNMMRDILLTNRDNVRAMIHGFQSNLARFESYLSEDDEQAMIAFMRSAQQRREGMFQ